MEDSMEDEGPPPTPMWTNTSPAPQSPSRATTVQRHWRGLRDRWKVVHRFAWVVSSGLDRLEEQSLLDLSVFLQSISESPSLSLQRKSSEPFAAPPPLNTTAYSGETLRFPLEEASVLDMVSCFCRGQQMPRDFVHELLKRQLRLLESLPNVVEYEVPANCVICIVGDIHGQFNDLMHIFRCHGFPSATRPYLFNGDFVDRGECGVEVTLTLFAWQQLYPNSVFMNRGNHEERSVHAIYGFLRECTRKYDNDIYELFNECFENLPLATLLNSKVLVLHGGVDEDMSLSSLSAAPRAEYVVNAAAGPGIPTGRPALLHPAMRARMPEIEARDAKLRPINSALWNDPMSLAGTLPNKSRGTGLMFGADVAQKFLERNDLGLIIRSHEQVLEGFDWPFGAGKLLATVFSASNYAGKTQNKGAYGLLTSAGAVSMPSTAGESGSDAHTHGYAFGLLRFVQFEAEHINALKVQQRNQHLINSLIFSRRKELAEAYARADTLGKGRLPASMWASVTKEVLQVPFSLLPMRQQLLGSAHASSTVDYKEFVSRFRLARPQLDAFFPVREYLLALMFKVDAEGTGRISLKEFNTVCRVLHRNLESGAMLANPADFLSALGPVGQKAAHSGSISIAEVAHQFRVLVPDASTPPSLIELLYRLDRDDIQAVARSPDGASFGRPMPLEIGGRLNGSLRGPDSPPHGASWSGGSGEDSPFRGLLSKASMDDDDDARSDSSGVTVAPVLFANFERRHDEGCRQSSGDVGMPDA